MFRKMTEILLIVFLSLFFFTSTKCYGKDLTWRNYNLSETGIYKGRGLPLFILNHDLSVSAFGGTELPEKIAPYTFFWGAYNSFQFKNKLNDADGNKVPGNDEIDIFASVHRLILTTPMEIIPGWSHFFQLVIPVVIMDIDSRFGEQAFSVQTGGIGDIDIGTGFLIPSIYKSKNVKIDSFLSFDISFPTGNYEKDRVMIGSNVYNIQFGLTNYLHFDGIGNGLFHEQDLFLMIPTKNRDFINPVTMNPHSEYQLGPSFQLILKLAYKLNEHYKIGMGGFFDYQLSEDKMDGDRIDNSREMAMGGGPLLIGSFGRFFFDLGLAFDAKVKNRHKGSKVYCILYYTFGG